MKKDHRLAYLAVGVGIGTAAGLLLARSSGAELRNDIRKSAQDARDFMKEQTQVLADSIENAADASKERISNNLKKGQEVVRDLSQTASHVLESAADVATRATEEISDRSRTLANKAGQLLEHRT